MKMEKRPAAILLKEAILQDRLTDVHKLVDEGVNLNNRDNLHGRTYVMIAAEFGRPLCLQYLIDSGADVSARDYDGCTALDLAIRFGRRKAVTTLLPHLSMEELRSAITEAKVLYGQKSGECLDAVKSALKKREDEDVDDH